MFIDIGPQNMLEILRNMGIHAYISCATTEYLSPSPYPSTFIVKLTHLSLFRSIDNFFTSEAVYVRGTKEAWIVIWSAPRKNSLLTDHHQGRINCYLLVITGKRIHTSIDKTVKKIIGIILRLRYREPLKATPLLHPRTIDMRPSSCTLHFLQFLFIKMWIYYYLSHLPPIFKSCIFPLSSSLRGLKQVSPPKK